MSMKSDFPSFQLNSDEEGGGVENRTAHVTTRSADSGSGVIFFAEEAGDARSLTVAGVV